MQHTSLTDQSIASAGVDETVDQIKTQTDATLTLSSTGGTLTADGTEQTLYIDNEPLGLTDGRTLRVDLDAMQGGDTTNLRVYYRLSDGGGLQLLDYASYTGADGGLANSCKLVEVDLGPYRHGIQATLEQSAGTNRTYPWEIYLEA